MIRAVDVGFEESVSEESVIRPRVFVAVPLADDLLQALGGRCDVTIHAGPHPIPAGALKEALAAADGVLATPLIPFHLDIIDSAPRLRAIANIGVGYDNVDLQHATARGILVANTPGVLSDAVADCTMGMIIAIARRLADTARIVRAGDWGLASTDIPLGVDLKDKTLALIGYGRIGWEVAARARAFKMRVIFFDPLSTLTPLGGVERVDSLESTLRMGDFVSLHVDLNPSTRHLIGEREFGWMKRTAFLINTARGSVVDQAALCDALASSAIAGAALDVLELEPPSPSDRILSLENVLILPHIGSATVETRRAMAELAVRNLTACLYGERCAYVVNKLR